MSDPDSRHWSHRFQEPNQLHYGNHVFCDGCWATRCIRAGEPGRQPVRVADTPSTCCGCGAVTEAGIWVRERGAILHCKDLGPTHEETA